MTSTRAARVDYVCSGCGVSSPKWQGRCDACGLWNTLAEVPAGAGVRRAVPAGAPVRLDAVDEGGCRRHGTGIGELDRVLGGGIVAGSLVLLGGDPGIGKSTLALQLAARLGAPDHPALYLSGEESPGQVAMRATRLGCRVASIAVAAETDLDAVSELVERERPPLAVVDSVQTLSCADAAGAPGSPGQVREAVGRLLAVAKRTGVPVVLVGHVTKEGAIAGPRTLEHMVDVVLYLEGERLGEHRLLRGVKNRFGGTGEIGLFTMAGDGLLAVDAPGRAYLDDASLAVPGNVLTVTCEGTRPLAVEVQALVASTAFAIPRRTSGGFDLGRLHLLIAVLERRAGVQLGQADVYLNVAGGVRLADPAVDLAVAVAIASAARDVAVAGDTVVLGEVGLAGEVRRAGRLDARLAEAAALGQRTAVVPAGGGVRRAPLPVREVGSVRDALNTLGIERGRARTQPRLVVAKT